MCFHTLPWTLLFYLNIYPMRSVVKSSRYHLSAKLICSQNWENKKIIMTEEICTFLWYLQCIPRLLEHQWIVIKHQIWIIKRAKVENLKSTLYFTDIASKKQTLAHEGLVSRLWHKTNIYVPYPFIQMCRLDVPRNFHLCVVDKKFPFPLDSMTSLTTIYGLPFVDKP